MSASLGPFLHLPLFEGPLDLLLHLCRRHELSVAELPIAEVTEQFLAYLEVMEELQIEVAGEFVEMASVLCLLKSRSILPRLDLPGEDDEDSVEGTDPRAELVQRLLEYRSFRDAADELDRRPRFGWDFFVSSQPPREAAGLSELDAPLDVDLTDLLFALRDLLAERARGEPVHDIGEARLPLEVCMREVIAQLTDSGKGTVQLRHLFVGAVSRAAVVVTFLAILHLAQLGHVRLQQRSHLASIAVMRRWTDAPPAIAEGADAG